MSETGLFREKRGWFRSLFPVFMKYVTGGYVSEAEAGDRLAQVVYDPVASKSGVYWSWNGNAQQVGLYDPRRVARARAARAARSRERVLRVDGGREDGPRDARASDASLRPRMSLDGPLLLFSLRRLTPVRK